VRLQVDARIVQARLISSGESLSHLLWWEWRRVNGHTTYRYWDSGTSPSLKHAEKLEKVSFTFHLALPAWLIAANPFTVEEFAAIALVGVGLVLRIEISLAGKDPLSLGSGLFEGLDTSLGVLGVVRLGRGQASLSTCSIAKIHVREVG
jgi:hypothetical protein